VPLVVVSVRQPTEALVLTDFQGWPHLPMAMRKSPFVASRKSPLVAKWKSPLLCGLACHFRELWAWAVTVIAPTVTTPPRGALLKSARERMNIISAYRQAGSYRGAAELCGTTHKTVKRVIERAEAGGPPPPEPRPRNVDAFTELVATRVEKSKGKMSAKRMLRIARAAGYQGSARNFRRLVAEQKVLWRNANRHQRRPAGMRVPAVLRAYLGGRAEI
jgi:transposase